MVNNKIEIRKSKIEGRGLFARNKITKGEIVLVFEGKPIKKADLPKNSDLGDLFPTGIDSYLIVNQPELLINHSCDPNAGFLDNFTLIATRDIDSDEELTFDYATVGVDGWEAQCNCGSSNCRGIISDFKNLPKTLRLKYKDITPKWVLEFDKL